MEFSQVSSSMDHRPPSIHPSICEHLIQRMRCFSSSIPHRNRDKADDGQKHRWWALNVVDTINVTGIVVAQWSDAHNRTVTKAGQMWTQLLRCGCCLLPTACLRFLMVIRIYSSEPSITTVFLYFVSTVAADDLGWRLMGDRWANSIISIIRSLQLQRRRSLAQLVVVGMFVATLNGNIISPFLLHLQLLLVLFLWLCGLLSLSS